MKTKEPKIGDIFLFRHGKDNYSKDNELYIFKIVDGLEWPKYIKFKHWPEPNKSAYYREEFSNLFKNHRVIKLGNSKLGKLLYDF